MNTAPLKRAAAAAIESKKELLFGLADRIFRNPEPGLKEFKAAAWLSAALEGEGFRVRRRVGGLDTAFRGVCRGRRPKPVITFMGEFDALPIGHACGHNLIGPAALGAGIGTRAVLPRLPGGTVEVLGTPAEEAGGGKIFLVEAGVFKGRDAALMIHPWGGCNHAYLDKLEVQRMHFKYYGRSAHASSAPQEGINALDAVINTFNNVNALRQHILPEARIHGIIKHGGEKPNIIPDYTEAHFYVRALDGAYLDGLVERVKDCARAGAKAAGARIRIWSQPFRYQGSLRVKTLTDVFAGNMELLGAPVSPPPVTGGVGSSDFGNVSQVVPGLHGYVEVGRKGEVIHSPEFRKTAGGPRGRKGLLLGAKALAFTAIDLLAEPKLMARVKSEFSKLRRERGRAGRRARRS